MIMTFADYAANMLGQTEVDTPQTMLWLRQRAFLFIDDEWEAAHPLLQDIWTKTIHNIIKKGGVDVQASAGPREH
jgi:hypothetical protein